ncbi:MAG: malto-oligosyltrehalose synthase [Verrucomicrobia bacterium]|nr:malto-oligosyltrehalose synthase [Verrucomicrobiota bacterium]
MAFKPRIPIATYRLQFSRNFTFKDAVGIIPYLEKLGISDVYSSPFYRSRGATDHGYDVINHNELNPALGTMEEFQTFVAALKERNMGHIADFVPNHMGIADPDNLWWMDVLENGPGSTYAPFFDIDWDPLKQQLRDKVLLPVLGDQYGKVLERGEFGLDFHDGAFFVKYFDWVFPLNPRTYPQILRIALEKLHGYDEEVMYLELESIITALEHLPLRTQIEEEKIRERAREKEVAKRRIARLCAEFPQVADAIQRAINRLEGKVGDSRSFDLLDNLLNSQPYRLSYWRVAAEEINYRRFFDVNELAAIKVENPVVFETIHRWLFQLLADGSVTGVRIDHVDGLQDPRKYLSTLQLRYQDGSDEEFIAAVNPEHGCYLIVEKILEEEERLRSDWPVHGTTGYDFAYEATQLLVDSSNGDRFSRIYREFIDRYVHVESLVYEKKKLVMEVTLASDIESLGHMLSELAERDRLHRDFTLDTLSTVVSELIACFPVYRTYISAEAGVSESDRHVILRAVRAAKRRNAAMDPSIFDFLRGILLFEHFDSADETTRELQLQFVYKFQQSTGPIMAKGLEDTAFYIFNRLTGLNEVGGAPQQFGMSLERFHERTRLRLAETPNTLLTLTTHDTKRSEDVRARIAVLSELPDQWQSWIHEWQKLATGAKSDLEGEIAPNANEEYFYYQTLLGTWPLNEEDAKERYVERIQRYMLKAIKEAKVNSSWVSPNENWENAVSRFVAKTLEPDHLFRQAIAKAAEEIAWHGMLNSLSQTILKLTCPGVPDFYQGSELWDLRLVDPDNRGPIDYSARQEALEQIEGKVPETLLSDWKNGFIKLAIVHTILQLRKRSPRLFQSGTYSSLYATGSKRDCCVAFHRRSETEEILVIVPRFTTRLGGINQPFDWGNTQLLIDESVPAMRDVLSSRKLAKGQDSLSLKALQSFPFAVFSTL